MGFQFVGRYRTAEAAAVVAGVRISCGSGFRCRSQHCRAQWFPLAPQGRGILLTGHRTSTAGRGLGWGGSAAFWIPAFAGMTGEVARMTWGGGDDGVAAGMTRVDAGWAGGRDRSDSESLHRGLWRTSDPGARGGSPVALDRRRKRCMGLWDGWRLCLATPGCRGQRSAAESSVRTIRGGRRGLKLICTDDFAVRGTRARSGQGMRRGRGGGCGGGFETRPHGGAGRRGPARAGAGGGAGRWLGCLPSRSLRPLLASRVLP